MTSGTFSPTLQVSLAMALVDTRSPPRSALALTVDVRGHREPAHVVKLPFYKRPSTISAHRLIVARRIRFRTRLNSGSKY